MTVEEAQKKLTISTDERAAIETYISYRHTDVNMLADFDVRLLDELQSKGWGIDQTGEYLQENLDVFLKSYSVMYKNSKSKNSEQRKLIRGTSRNEIKGLSVGESYDRILSTSRREDIARTFCEYENAALIWISTEEGTPYLDVNSFVGEENLNKDEKEVIIAPFTQIKKFDSNYSRYGSYKYCSAVLGPPKLEQVPEEELETLREYIIENYAQNVADGKDIINLEWKIPHLEERKRRMAEQGLKTKDDYEDYEYIENDISTARKRKKELDLNCDKMKKTLTRYLKGCCKQIELEIDQAHEVVQEHERKIKEEKEREKKEEIRKNSIDNNIDNREKGIESCKRFPESLNQEYDKLKQKEQSYIALAGRLGIDFTKTLGNANNIEMNIKRIEENLRQIAEKLSQVEVNETDLTEESVNKSKDISILSDRVKFGEELASSLNIIREGYNQECILDIKRNLDIKVQTLIKNARIDRLREEKETLQSAKPSILGRITGNDKSNQAKLENVNLQIRLLMETPLIEKEKYSTKESMADLYVYSQKEGPMTPEMKKLYYAIGKEISKEDNEDVTTLIDMKLKSQLLPVQEGKKGLFSWIGRNKRELDRISNNNESLKSQISHAVNSNRNSNSNYAQNIQSAASQFEMRIQSISNCTRLEDEMGNEIVNKEKTAELW